MKEIIEFLRSCPAFFVATSDEDNRPCVRPFSLVMEWNGKLAFGTNTTKAVTRQLEANPHIEICAYRAERGEWMRIRGTVKFTRDESLAKLIFETMPSLSAFYPEKENDPRLIGFYIDSGEAATFSFSAMDDPKNIVSW